MTMQNDAVTWVECPECSTDVGISLPRSADIASIVIHSLDEGHDTDRTGIGRPREHRKSCASDHLLSVLYDW